jgi:hypothetical protein
VDDYSTHLLDVERHTKKASDYLIAVQSVGPTAKARGLLDAELHVLELIVSARMVLASIRSQQTPRAWQGDRDV